MLSRIVATFDEVLATPEVASFAVGTAASPRARADALGADAVVELYRSACPAELFEVEDRLRHHAGSDPRSAEHARAASDAGASETVGVVFVALWAADSV